jgi:hypothetical protein
MVPAEFFAGGEKRSYFSPTIAYSAKISFLALAKWSKQRAHAVTYSSILLTYPAPATGDLYLNRRRVDRSLYHHRFQR